MKIILMLTKRSLTTSIRPSVLKSFSEILFVETEISCRLERINSSPARWLVWHFETQLLAALDFTQSESQRVERNEPKTQLREWTDKLTSVWWKPIPLSFSSSVGLAGEFIFTILGMVRWSIFSLSGSFDIFLSLYLLTKLLFNDSH